MPSLTNTPRKMLVLPVLGRNLFDGGARIAGVAIAGHFIYCSCIIGIGLLIMGAVITALFQGTTPFDDPFCRSMQTTGLVFLIIGILLCMCGIMLCLFACLSKENVGKTSSAAKANTSCMRDDPLSLAPYYPPVILKPYPTPFDRVFPDAVATFEDHESEDIPGVLPGSVLESYTPPPRPRTQSRRMSTSSKIEEREINEESLEVSESEEEEEEADNNEDNRRKESGKEKF